MGHARKKRKSKSFSRRGVVHPSIKGSGREKRRCGGRWRGWLWKYESKSKAPHAKTAYGAPGHVSNAKVHGERDLASWLAAAERNAREGGGKTYSHLFLRGLLPRPWGCGNGLKSMGSEIWQSCDFCLAGGVGRQDYCRVKIGRGTRRIGKEGPTLSKQQARKGGPR